MIFHSILFENKIESIDRQVLDDLKISEILGKNTLQNLGILSDKERQNRKFIQDKVYNLEEQALNLKNFAIKYSEVKSSYESCTLPLSRALLFTKCWDYLRLFCNTLLDISIDEDTPYFLRLKNEVSQFCANDETKEKFDACKKAIADFGEVSFGIKVKENEFEYRVTEHSKTIVDKIVSIYPHDMEYSFERILDYPELCEKLLSTNSLNITRITDFEKKYSTSEDNIQGIETIARELESIFEVNEFFNKVKEYGLPTTTPTFVDKKEIKATEAYDVTLIAKGEKKIVPNDIDMSESQHLYFLVGANGGGKTTYLRLVGVNMILAMNGLPVIAKSMSLYPIDSIFTHFPHDENFVGEGRFANEKRRVDEIVSNLGECSLVLLNETYSTTNDQKSTEYTNGLATTLNESGAYGIYVTHANNISANGVGKLSVVIDGDDENARTFKVAIAKEYGGSFAIDILKKYGLDSSSLAKKFGGENEE